MRVQPDSRLTPERQATTGKASQDGAFARALDAFRDRLLAAAAIVSGDAPSAGIADDLELSDVMRAAVTQIRNAAASPVAAGTKSAPANPIASATTVAEPAQPAPVRRAAGNGLRRPIATQVKTATESGAHTRASTAETSGYTGPIDIHGDPEVPSAQVSSVSAEQQDRIFRLSGELRGTGIHAAVPPGMAPPPPDYFYDPATGYQPGFSVVYGDVINYLDPIRGILRS